MDFSNSRIYSRRHLLEFLGIFIFSIVILNPFNISIGFLYSSTTPEILKKTILDLGLLAPVFMVFLEALQVLIAPLPPVTMVASGYTFGFFYGSIYSFIGMALGSAAAIMISRRFGKPLVTHFISEEHMSKFHNLTERHGPAVFTAFFVAPGFPHDILCYVAGLTDLDTKKLIASVSLGRLPTLIALVLTGDSIASAQTKTSFLILIILTLTGLIAVKNEERLIEYVKKLKTFFRSSI